MMLIWQFQFASQTQIVSGPFFPFPPQTRYIALHRSSHFFFVKTKFCKHVFITNSKRFSSQIRTLSTPNGKGKELLFFRRKCFFQVTNMGFDCEECQGWVRTSFLRTFHAGFELSFPFCRHIIWISTKCHETCNARSEDFHFVNIWCRSESFPICFDTEFQ